MRGQVMKDRYTQMLAYKPEHETGARLAKQLMTLGMGVSVFRNESRMSDRTFGVVKQVAKSTVPDRAEEVVKQIYKNAGDDYVGTENVSLWSRMPRETCRPICQDLEMLGVLERDSTRQSYWRLSDKMFEMTESLGMYRRKEKSEVQTVVDSGAGMASLRRIARGGGR